MADPMLVEFLRSRVGYGIDEEFADQKIKRRLILDKCLREGKLDEARYHMGIVDGLSRAESVLEMLRKQEGNDG